MNELLIATNNLNKRLELVSILKGQLTDVDILTLHQFPEFKPEQEKGKTFLENAEAKALYAAKKLKKLVLADDSGLVVPALDGEPGIFSARYAGEEASDKDNRNKLIEKLSLLNEEERKGYFECAIALATPEKVLKVTLGRSEGYLVTEARGGGGFGYDSLFVKYEYNKTFAELDGEVKNKISARGKALEKMRNCLLDTFLQNL